MAKKRAALALEAPFSDVVQVPTLGDIDMDKYMPFSQERFEARGSVEEGVSGRAGIDTSYENTEVDGFLSETSRGF